MNPYKKALRSTVFDPNRRALFTVHESAIDQVIPLKAQKRLRADSTCSPMLAARDQQLPRGPGRCQYQRSLLTTTNGIKKTKLNLVLKMWAVCIRPSPEQPCRSTINLSDMAIRSC